VPLRPARARVGDEQAQADDLLDAQRDDDGMDTTGL